MKRRALLTKTVGILVFLTGCTSNSSPDDSNTNTSMTTDSEPALTFGDRTAAPGESGQVVITAKNVRRIKVSEPADSSAKSADSGILTATENTNTESSGKPIFDYGNATATPDFQIILESYPPSWKWKSVQSEVKMKIPFRIPQNATSDNYRYSVTAYQNKSSTTRSSTISIQPSTDNG